MIQLIQLLPLRFADVEFMDCVPFLALLANEGSRRITLLPGPWMCLLSLPQVFEDSSIVYFGRSRHEMNP